MTDRKEQIRSFWGKQCVPNIHIVNLHYTAYCNLECPQCNSSCHQAPSTEYLPLDRIKEILIEIVGSGIYIGKVHLMGGEPTFHPQYFKTLPLLQKYFNGIPVILYTHGQGQEVRYKIARTPNFISLCPSARTDLSKKTASFRSFNIAPIDIPEYKECDFSLGCWVSEICGVAVFTNGWFICNPAVHIDRVMKLGQGFSTFSDLQNLSKVRQQMNCVCRFCGNFKADNPETIDHHEESETWRRAYEKYASDRNDLTENNN